MLALTRSVPWSPRTPNQPLLRGADSFGCSRPAGSRRNAKGRRMRVRILKPFLHPDSPRPFQQEEMIVVSEEIGKQWIKEGKATAVPVDFSPNIAPTRRKREKAVIG